MSKKWLTIYLKFSGFNYSLKKRLVQSDNWLKSVPYFLLIIISELGFAVISLPMYLLVPPKKVQEEGFIFPTKEKDRAENIRTYNIRRKISLGTFFGALGLFILKLAFIGITSVYLLSGQILFAEETEGWAFNSAGNYIYDSGKIDVIGGTARLKNIGGGSGSTTNSGFDAGSDGWTFEDSWSEQGAVNEGSYEAEGGNPGGYLETLINGKRNALGAAFWIQPFTVTVDSADTATLNFDWMVNSLDPAYVESANLYAFIDETDANPNIDEAVWTSGNLTATTTWASTTPIDIIAKIQTAGTYYLKLDAYVRFKNIENPPDVIKGIDNAAVNWEKSGDPAYASDMPTIYPTDSIEPSVIDSWTSFTETATKNGGEIYYQLSDDDGATWQYWNGSVWATASSSNDYNIADTVDENIGSFPAVNMKIMWKAFLESDGAQEVVLDDITVGYTDNDLPDISSISLTQSATTSLVYIDYILQDNESDPASLEAYEYSLTGDFAGEHDDLIASTTDLSHDGITNLETTATGTSHTFAWDGRANLGNIYSDSVYIRFRAHDGIEEGPYAISSAFSVDFAPPDGLNSLIKLASTGSTVTLGWSSEVADNNFSHYELWHGSSEGDVNNRTGSASEWDDADDAGLININTISTVITGLNITDNYYVKIWAIDNYKNEATIAAINVYEPAPPATPPTPAPSGGGTFIAPDTKAPDLPTLSPLKSPVNLTEINISGLAEPRSGIDLYDNGVLAGRLVSAVDNDGKFSQVFKFSEGEHILTAIAVDSSGNESEPSNPVSLAIDLTAPAAPIVLSHESGQDIIDSIPELAGLSEPFARINIVLDKINIFNVSADSKGAWRFILPDGFALEDGEHSFILSATDRAGNSGPETIFNLMKVAIPPAAPPVIAAPPSIIVPVPEEIIPEEIVPAAPIPSEAEIAEITEAEEIPEAVVPAITQAGAEIADDVLRFTGTASPNTDVAVYIHSDQALVYRVKTDDKGVWNVDHSQDVVELAPGLHSIFAVAVDTASKVKSRPSAVSTFKITKSLWVTLYNLLNLQTTLLVLFAIAFTMMWLYKIRRRTAEVVV